MRPMGMVYVHTYVLCTRFCCKFSTGRVNFHIIVHNRCTRLILCLRPANERRRYEVTPSLIGWAQTCKKHVSCRSPPALIPHPSRWTSCMLDCFSVIFLDIRWHSQLPSNASKEKKLWGTCTCILLGVFFQTGLVRAAWTSSHTLCSSWDVITRFTNDFPSQYKFDGNFVSLSSRS